MFTLRGGGSSRQAYHLQEQSHENKLSEDKCCESGSGSGLVRIILPDPHPAGPDQYKFQAN